jgi:hypothetical protein
LPSLAACTAARRPAGPLPMTTRSNCFTRSPRFAAAHAYRASVTLPLQTLQSGRGKGCVASARIGLAMNCLPLLPVRGGLRSVRYQVVDVGFAPEADLGGLGLYYAGMVPLSKSQTN